MPMPGEYSWMMERRTRDRSPDKPHLRERYKYIQKKPGRKSGL